MFYYLFYELIYGRFKDQDWYLVKALNVFQYVTFRTAYATITGLLIALLFGRKVIDGLKKWNIGQQIREEGPQAHIAKRDTTPMGRLLLIASVVSSTLLWAPRLVDHRDVHGHGAADRVRRFEKRGALDG